MGYNAGLDLPTETTEVCVVDDQGRTQMTVQVESTGEAIAQALCGVPDIERTVLENGLMSMPICRALEALGVPIVCMDSGQPNQSLKAMRTNKTNILDAAGLA